MRINHSAPIHFTRHRPTRAMSPEVDLDKCTGHGICESIAEDGFEVQDDDPCSSTNERAECDGDRVLQAVTQCPAAALRFVD